MKKIFVIISAAAAAVLSLSVLSGCNQELQQTGNKIVSDAKDYLKSEAGFDGDVSKLGNDAVSYLKDELGLNNSSNKVIEGVWLQEDETNGDWQWSFDGGNKCTLKGITTGFSGNGTYSVDETAKTVTVCMNEWDSEKVYTYTLTSTLSDTMLDLEEKYSSYKLVKQK